MARRTGVPEASLRRHFKGCQWRPKEARKPPTPAAPAQRAVTRGHLEKVAAEFGLTFREVLRHHVLCLGGDVETASDEEAHELCEMAGLPEAAAR